MPLVQQILEEDSKARDDYLWLWLRVWDKLGMMWLIEIQSVYEMLRSLPSFTTVERARRFVVGEEPRLQGKNHKVRKTIEKAFREAKWNVDKIREVIF